MKKLFLLLLIFTLPALAVDLREDTAVTIMVGPIVDSVLATVETGLTLSQADIRLSKNAGNMAQKNESTSCTHDEIGMYSCPLDATDTNTAGILTVAIFEAGTMAWSRDYQIVATGFYDLIDGTTSVMTSRQAGNMRDTTISGTPSSQTVFVLAAGATNNDAYVDATVTIQGGTEECHQTAADYVGSTKTLTIAAACPFTIAANDTVLIHSASGSSIRTVSAELATVDGIVDDILVDTSTTLDAALAVVDGNVDSILADTGTDGVALANDSITAAVMAANSIGPSEIAANAIGASELAADAVDEIWNEVIETAGTTYTGRCIMAALAAYVAGEFSTSGNTTTYKDTGGNSTRIVGTVTASGRGTMSITCP